MKKRLFSLVLAILIVNMFGTVSSAATMTQTSKVSQVTYIKGNLLNPVDTSAMEGITLTRKSKGNSDLQQRNSNAEREMKRANYDTIQASLRDFMKSNILPLKKQSNEIKSLAENTYQIFTISHTVPEQGKTLSIGPITLQSGQICQAQLDEPVEESSNYYLVMLKVNSSGEATIVDASTYSNSDAPDSVGVVNKSGSAETYYVGVLADKVADPTDEFTLHLSLGILYDSLETNENAFTASKFSEDIDEEMGAYTVKGATINSSYDNDWYEVNVPTAKELVSLIVEPVDINANIISNIGVEVYKTPDGSKLIKQSNDGSSFKAGVGHYYIRVFSTDNESTFNDTTYNLKITPGRYAETAHYAVLMNGQPLPIQKYELGGERYALLSGSEFEWKVQYYSTSGRPATAANDEIYVQINDRHWRPGTGRCYEVKKSEKSKKDVADLIIEKVPPVYGAGTGVSDMRYDYDVSLYMYSEIFGVEYDDLIFITSRIMS